MSQRQPEVTLTLGFLAKLQTTPGTGLPMRRSHAPWRSAKKIAFKVIDERILEDAQWDHAEYRHNQQLR